MIYFTTTFSPAMLAEHAGATVEEISPSFWAEKVSHWASTAKLCIRHENTAMLLRSRIARQGQNSAISSHL